MRLPLLTLVALVSAGCVTRPGPVSFLGIPETESGSQGPVGLISGKPCQIRTVTPVSEASYEEYLRVKGEDRILAEEDHDGYVYYAVKKQRSIHFDDASAIIDVTERFKSKRP